MPVIPETGEYVAPGRAGHPLMPSVSILRKLARITIAANVVAYEIEHGHGTSERMKRALAAELRWGAEPDVVAWVQRMKERGEIEEGFLA